MEHCISERVFALDMVVITPPGMSNIFPIETLAAWVLAARHKLKLENVKICSMRPCETELAWNVRAQLVTA